MPCDQDSGASTASSTRRLCSVATQLHNGPLRHIFAEAGAGAAARAAYGAAPSSVASSMHSRGPAPLAGLLNVEGGKSPWAGFGIGSYDGPAPADFDDLLLPAEHRYI